MHHHTVTYHRGTELLVLGAEDGARLTQLRLNKKNYFAGKAAVLPARLPPCDGGGHGLLVAGGGAVSAADCAADQHWRARRDVLVRDLLRKVTPAVTAACC